MEKSQFYLIGQITAIIGRVADVPERFANKVASNPLCGLWTFWFVRTCQRYMDEANKYGMAEICANLSPDIKKGNMNCYEQGGYWLGFYHQLKVISDIDNREIADE